jgi:subtilisin-like proprotein convertase family protein
MTKKNGGDMSTSIKRSTLASTFAATLIALLALFTGAATFASPGKPPVSAARSGALAADAVAVWATPRVDVAALLAEDAANVGRFEIPFRIGFPMATEIVTGMSGTWEELGGDDRLWRLRLRSAGALWMVLGFDSFRLQDGASLWVYDAARKTVLGPFTTADVRDHGELWTVPIEGDELVVELFWPAKLRYEAPRLHLGTVSHGYRPFGTIGRAAWLEGEGAKAIGDSGSCNIDVACPLGADWQDEKRGVVILLSGGSGFCSGSMINNTANDCKPYVLTAAHCSAGASTAYGFNFERTGCGTGNPGAPTTSMVSGGTIRGNYAATDFTLVEMSSLPPESFNFYFNGFSADPNPSTQSWVIHHPSGDVKMISFDDDPPINGSNWGANHWRVQNYEQGTTEGGSSGSPLFDQNSRITGQLHGGTASCSSITYDEFGKVSESWAGGGTPATRLSNWLDPVGGGTTLTWDGLNGSVCFFQPAGTVSVNRARYACSDTVAIQLRDDSLRGNATQAVSIASNTETTPETVILSAAGPNSGNFNGTFALASGAPVASDGQLSVSHGDTITVTYTDADDGQGGTNVVRTTTATVDCLPPAITNVQSSNVTGNSARITWTTDEPADSRVRYGTATPPGSSSFAAPATTAHTLDLTGLAECTLHYYSVESADTAANLATDDASGAYYTFATGKNVSPSYPSSGPPVAIPDATPAGATSTIVVTDTQTVLDVKVTVNLTHTFDGDLSLALVAPNGTVVALAERRGSSGDNFTNTTFDDAAATSIAAGAAPFTGSFRPESPLSAATGISAAGNWQLRVVDRASTDIGTIDNWTLTLRFPAAACGPHAKYRAHALAADQCSSGGAGSGNGVWDAGETVDVPVTLENDGTVALTGVTATLVPTTAGVTMAIPTASYPNLAIGGAASSNAPHFRAALPASSLCGGTVGFDVVVTSDQGSWTSSWTQGLGQVLVGGGTALDEPFTAGIPGSWTVVNGGSGGGAAATWTTANPGGRSAASPMANPLAIVDSDNAGTGATQDEELITPVMNLATATGVTLEFDQYFRHYGGGQAEKGDVDVRSSLTGGAWVNVLRNQGADSANPNHRTLDITAQAAGASDVQVRFHYYSGTYEWYWQVDNVKVTYPSPGGCSMNVCAAPPSAPPPVPDGTFGAPMLSSLAAADGSAIDLTWDVATCVGGDYHLLYGPLSEVSSYTIGGGACDLGTSGAYGWTGVPADSLWYVVVSEDGASLEGSWGRDSSGAERGGAGASGVCAMTTRNNAGTCP